MTSKPTLGVELQGWVWRQDREKGKRSGQGGVKGRVWGRYVQCRKRETVVRDSELGGAMGTGIWQKVVRST